MKEISWLEHSTLLLDKNAVERGDTIAWSAFHASKENASTELHTTKTQLLPLFYEKAATAAMIKHGMNVVRWSTEFLNPGCSCKKLTGNALSYAAAVVRSEEHRPFKLVVFVNELPGGDLR